MHPITFALPALVAGAVAAIVVAMVRAERRRTEAMELASHTIGFVHEPTGDLDLLRALADLPLFGRGHSRKVRNLMTGRIGDAEVKLFDYAYTTGGGKNSHTFRQTVALFPATRALPDFVLAPENVLHRIGQLFGYQDIDFEQNADFSSHYLLRGSDETAIRAAFGPDRVAFLAGDHGWTVEARSGFLGIYRSGKRCKPGELPAFLESAQRVWQALAR